VILIFCAFSGELEPLRGRVRAEKSLGIEGFRGCHGTIGKADVAIVASGIGMRRARASARDVLDRMHAVDLIILTGVAGGLVDNLEIGDVVLADRLFTREGANTQSERAIEVPRAQLEMVSVILDTAGIDYARGAFLTVKYPLMTGAEKRLAGEHTGAIAVDMETAAIAFEAAARGIPFVAMRTIMDTVDHDLVAAGLADEYGRVRPLKAVTTFLRRPTLVAGAIRVARNLRRASHSMATAVEALTQRLG
jgi:adenosylhomocysteine nucleosidase